MKESNYCSLEVSKKLVDAGIVIDTEFFWINSIFRSNFVVLDSDWKLSLKRRNVFQGVTIPAPTFAEIWTELPDEIRDANSGYYILMHSKEVIGYYNAIKTVSWLVDFRGISNPANAAAELLIWVKEREK